jgi:hypothetical protein
MKKNVAKGLRDTDAVRTEKIDQAKEQIAKQVADIISWILTCSSNFLEFEKQLIPQVYELGRLFISLFLSVREGYWQRNHSEIGEGSKSQGLKDRLIGTIFGKVRYWRTYIYRNYSALYKILLDKQTNLQYKKRPERIERFEVSETNAANSC